MGKVLREFQLYDETDPVHSVRIGKPVWLDPDRPPRVPRVQHQVLVWVDLGRSRCWDGESQAA